MPTPRRAVRFALHLVPLLLALGACRAPFESDPVLGGPPPPPPTGPILPFRIGSSGPDFARGVVNDPLGNAYVVSYFAGTVSFDARVGTGSGRTAMGPYDIALTKYAADGTFQWVYAIGGVDADVPFDVKRAPDGALYVTGYITAGAVCSGHVVPNAGDRDIFLMRVSASGTCDWAIAVGGTGADEGHAVVVESDGDVDITGSFTGSVDFDPGSGTAVLVSRGGTDGFIARYGSDGTFKAVTQFGGVGDDSGNALALSQFGEVVVGGEFTGTATFGPAQQPILLVSVGGLDYFIAEFAPQLGLEWAIRGGGPGDDRIATNGLIVDSGSGFVYATGTFTGTADVDPGDGTALLVGHGDTDVFLARYDNLGNYGGLAREFGGSGTDGVSGFARDDAGNFYLSGSFQSSVDFDPGSGTKLVVALGSSGAADAYVLSLTPAGDLRWINPLGAVISGDANFAIASGVSLGIDGTVWVVGRIFGQVDMDPSTTAVAIQSLGDADQFVVTYDATTGAIRR